MKTSSVPSAVPSRPTINELIAAGYYMVAILDRPPNQNYSSRAGGAAYCVAEEDTQSFQRFQAALYAQQPSEAWQFQPRHGGSFAELANRAAFAM
jgi:hypothetical protein